MPGTHGREMLLQLRTGTGPDVYTTIAGCTNHTIKFNSESIDVTTKSDGVWTEQIDGGLRSAEVTMEGVFRTDTQLESVIDAIITGTVTLLNFRIITAAGPFKGLFKITGFELSGENTDAQQFSCTITSSGPITEAP